MTNQLGIINTDATTGTYTVNPAWDLLSDEALFDFENRLKSEDKMSAVELAVLFHNTYEKLAPEFGYETQEDTREFDPESKNGRLMVAVCEELLNTVVARTEVLSYSSQNWMSESNPMSGSKESQTYKPPEYKDATE